jgi:hypothetical protein
VFVEELVMERPGFIGGRISAFRKGKRKRKMSRIICYMIVNTRKSN